MNPIKGQVSKGQLVLYKLVQQIFPAAQLLTNFRYKDLPDFFEYDLFLPELSLAFEYQGESHYHRVAIYGSLRHQQIKDLKKKLWSREIGVTLICIPYWWNRSVDSLVAMIGHARPELISNIT